MEIKALKPILMLLGLGATLFILVLLIVPLFQFYVLHTIQIDQVALPLTLISSIADAITVIGLAAAPLSRGYEWVTHQIQQVEREITILISYTHQGLQWAKWIKWILQNNPKYSIYTENLESTAHSSHMAFKEQQKNTYLLSIVSPDYLQGKVGNEVSFHNWKMSHTRKNGTGVLLSTRADIYQKLSDTNFDLRLVNFADPMLTTEIAAEGRLQTAFPRRLKVKIAGRDFPNISERNKWPRYPGYISAPSYLPTRNQHFIGRNQYLRSIETFFDQGEKTIILTGLIGLGKSEIAKEYAYRNQDQYSYVFWLSMNLPTQRNEKIGEILAFLDPSTNPIQASDQTFQTWLAQQNEDEILLVLDECQDPSDAQNYISNLKKGHVLITTSRSMGAHEPTAEAIEIGRMEKEEAIELLLQLSGLTNHKNQFEAAKRVVTELDSVPEALEAASCYVKSKKCSLDTYFDVYRQSHDELIKKYDRQFHDQNLQNKDEMIIIYTWWVYFEKGIKGSKAEEILSYCVMLDPTAISRKFIQDVLLDVLLPDMKTSELVDEIAKLAKIFLVHSQNDIVSIDLHISKFFKSWLGPVTQKQLADSIVTAISQFSPQKFASYYAFSSDYRAQLDACAKLIDTYNLTSPLVMNFYQMYGSVLQTCMHLEDAHMYLQKCIQLYENYQQQKQLSPSLPISKGQDPQIHAIRSKIVEAEILYIKGDYEGAKNLLDNELLEAQKTLLGKDHPEVATAHYQLLRLHSILKSMQEFSNEYQELETIWQGIQQDKLQQDERLELLKEKGSAAYMNAEYGASKQLYKEALALAIDAENQAIKQGSMIEAAQFSREIDICQAQKMRSVVALEEKDAFEKAALSYSAAQNMYEKYFNKNHSQVAQMYLNLAELYNKKGDTRKAVLLQYDRARAIYVCISPTHPQIAYIDGEKASLQGR